VLEALSGGPQQDVVTEWLRHEFDHTRWIDASGRGTLRSYFQAAYFDNLSVILREIDILVLG